MEKAKWLLVIPGYGGIIFMFIIYFNRSKIYHLSNREFNKIFIIYGLYFALCFYLLLFVSGAIITIISGSIDNINEFLLMITCFIIAGIPGNIYVNKIHLKITKAK